MSAMFVPALWIGKQMRDEKGWMVGGLYANARNRAEAAPRPGDAGWIHKGREMLHAQPGAVLI
jgi:hypothetical protein